MSITTTTWPCGCAVERAGETKEIMPTSTLRYCPLHGAAGELLAACRAAVGSLTICQMPRLDDRVASNETIIGVVLKSLHAVIIKAEPKPEATEGTKCTDATTPTTA